MKKNIMTDILEVVQHTYPVHIYTRRGEKNKKNRVVSLNVA